MLPVAFVISSFQVINVLLLNNRRKNKIETLLMSYVTVLEYTTSISDAPKIDQPQYFSNSHLFKFQSWYMIFVFVYIVQTFNISNIYSRNKNPGASEVKLRIVSLTTKETELSINKF